VGNRCQVASTLALAGRVAAAASVKVSVNNAVANRAAVRIETYRLVGQADK